jgi:dolichol kinase
MLPNWARKWLLAMRPREAYTFIASTPLVLAFVPFLFAPFPILGSVALIATGADAAACLIGKKYGTHPLKKNSKKTIEGFLAGGFCTFLIVVFITLIFNSLMPVNFDKILIMAIISTVLFLAVDFFTVNISDNILNPILTGISMWLIYVI